MYSGLSLLSKLPFVGQVGTHGPGFRRDERRHLA